MWLVCRSASIRINILIQWYFALLISYNETVATVVMYLVFHNNSTMRKFTSNCRHNLYKSYDGLAVIYLQTCLFACNIIYWFMSCLELKTVAVAFNHRNNVHKMLTKSNEIYLRIRYLMFQLNKFQFIRNIGFNWDKLDLCEKVSYSWKLRYL